MHFKIHTSHGLLCHTHVDRGFKGLKAAWIMHQVLELCLNIEQLIGASVRGEQQHDTEFAPR